MGSKRNRSILLLGAAFLTFGCLLAGASLAWFAPPQTSASITGITGEATGSYFSPVNGNQALGTEEYPYGIENAKQLYYFSWLQDMGFFNEDKKGKSNEDGTETGDGVIDKCYFVLMNDIDASDYILPPCGIAKYPFVGNFDGNNCLIKNLRVSNSISAGQITSYPKTLDSNNDRLTKEEFNSSPAIVGFFGIIGSYDADISYDTSVNAVKDLYFDNLTIQTSATSVMAGLLAGYANGSLDNCGVRSGKFEFSDGVSPIANSTFGESNSKLSKYSLIGDYNPSGFKWNGKPGGGQQTDFGGSIDMLTLNRRVSYIVNSAPSSNQYHATFESTTKGYNWLDGNGYTNLSSGSYLPINVDMDETKLSDVTGVKDTSNAYYAGHTSEPILDTNSGYITGGNARVRAQTSVGTVGNSAIRRAVKRVSGTTSSTSTNFDLFSDSEGKVISMDKLKSNVGFLTYSFSDGSVAAIYDDDDKDFVQSDNFVYAVKGSNVTGSSKKYVSASSFVKYSSVKSNFLQMLYDSTNAYYANSGSTAYAVYVPGFRFQSWTTDSTFTTTAEWLGEEKSITLHNNGVQFEIKKDGYITAVVDRYHTSGNLTFYNLYSVDMDNGAALTKINTIHKDSSGNITYNSDDASTKIFDFSPLTTTDTGMYCYQLFYFEVPIKKGAYFLSSYGHTGLDSNPYLLYLDIGANSGDGGQSGSTSKSEIDFTYYKDPAASTKTIAKISDEDFISSYCTFYISGNPGTVYFWRVNDGESIVLYYYFSAGTVMGEGTGAYQLGKEEDYTSN